MATCCRHTSSPCGRLSDGALPADLDVDAVARSADRHARSPRFWSALEASADAYATVATLAVEAGREPMLAAVPFLLTGYALDLPSGECANGPWQLAVTDPRVVVGPCRLRDSTETWDRTSGPVPIDEAGCRLWGCEPDERLDLAASTRVALTQKDFPVDRGVAAGVHLLAVCALRARPEPPAFVTDTPGAWCGDVRPPPR